MPSPIQIPAAMKGYSTEMPHRALVGCRVKTARLLAGWSQGELASRMGLEGGGQVVDAIERNRWHLQGANFNRLCEVTGRDGEYFMDPLLLSGEERFSWRAAPDTPEEALEKFGQQASGLIGLLQWLYEREGLLPAALERPAVRLQRHSSCEDARAAAEGLALRLDLGPVPAQTLAEKVESELGVPVLLVDTATTYYECNEAGRGISGAACHLRDIHAHDQDVILLNRHRPPAIRLFNLAHELFHVLTWERMEPPRREPDGFGNGSEQNGKRVERLADSFAAALLLPAYALDEWLDPARAGDLGHLREVAEKLQVAPPMFGWHLFRTGRIAAAARDQLATLEPQAEDSPPPLFSPTLLRLLHQVLDEGDISARRAAEATGLDMVEQAEMFVEQGFTRPYSHY